MKRRTRHILELVFTVIMAIWDRNPGQRLGYGAERDALNQR